MIAVFFGGRSCEHDISIITGLQTMSACPYPCAPVYIDGDGVWHTGEGFDSVNAVRNGKFKDKRVHLRPGERYLYCKNKKLFPIDAAVLCMHGVLGEDGSLQGMLQMCGIPYTGSGIAASSIGMNKILSKRVFKAEGLDVVPYVPLGKSMYEKDLTGTLEKVESTLGYPVIVKPCNLGSSIGITMANSAKELYKSLSIAFEWDDIVLIEKALTDFTEVNCAVLGDETDETEDLTVSETEQPVGWKDFLTFSDKYSGDVKTTRRKCPAEVGDKVNAQIKEYAARAFKAVGCAGVARIDFMVADKIYVNEINTIPGSLANPLFRRDMEFSKLIDRLIVFAKAREARFNALRRVYTPIDPIAAK